MPLLNHISGTVHERLLPSFRLVTYIELLMVTPNNDADLHAKISRRDPLILSRFEQIQRVNLPRCLQAVWIVQDTLDVLQRGHLEFEAKLKEGTK